MDPDAGRVGKLIFEHDEVDVSHLLRSKRRRVTCGVAFETDKDGTLTLYRRVHVSKAGKLVVNA